MQVIAAVVLREESLRVLRVLDRLIEVEDPVELPAFLNEVVDRLSLLLAFLIVVSRSLEWCEGCTEDPRSLGMNPSDDLLHPIDDLIGSHRLIRR